MSAQPLRAQRPSPPCRPRRPCRTTSSTLKSTPTRTTSTGAARAQRPATAFGSCPEPPCVRAIRRRARARRHVILPKHIAKTMTKGRLLLETEWRGLGVTQSRGWGHYAIHKCARARAPAALRPLRALHSYLWPAAPQAGASHPPLPPAKQHRPRHRPRSWRQAHRPDRQDHQLMIGAPPLPSPSLLPGLIRSCQLARRRPRSSGGEL